GGTDWGVVAGVGVAAVVPGGLVVGGDFPVGGGLGAAGSAGLGRRLGGIYGANVAGAIVGSLLGGFVLVPVLGTHHSMLLLAGANVLLGLALLRTLRWRLWLMPSLALLLIGWGATRPPPHAGI